MAGVVLQGVLWGLFVLRYPALLLGFVALALLLTAIRLGFRWRILPEVALILLNMALWMVSGLLTGGVTPGDLLSLGFYQAEGRVFILYAPLVFAGAAYLGTRELSGLVRTAEILAILSVILFGLWLVARPDLITAGVRARYWGLSSSHHGSGALMGALGVFLVIHGAVQHRTRRIVLGILTGLPLWASGSRTTLLAVLAVGLWGLLRVGGVRYLPRLAVGLALVLALGRFGTPDAYERFRNLARPAMVSSVIQTVRTSQWEPGGDKFSNIEGEGEFNALVRVLHWAYTYRLVTDSPLVGVGFARYNDFGLRFSGVQGVVYPALEAESRQVTAATAHNSYLYVLAELGVVGLALLLALWVRLGWVMRRAAAEWDTGSTMTRGFFLAAEGLVVFQLATGLAGHGLGAPALGLAGTTFIAAAYAHLRHLRAHAGSASGSRGGYRHPSDSVREARRPPSVTHSDFRP